MLSPVFDPARDLQISRVIKAPRRTVWRAWTDPASFEQWWVPAPAKCKVHGNGSAARRRVHHARSANTAETSPRI